MASVSGATSSLGNTSLRGFGGLASGIDRDEMIEAMTSGTQAKVDRQKGEMTKLQWKQEAYRSIIDKIIDLEDDYFSFASGSNLKSPSLFAKNIVTAIGDDAVTKFIKASGTSSWVDNLSIQAVDQLATAATIVSDKMDSDTEIKMENVTDLDQKVEESKLSGTQLIFGKQSITSNGDVNFNTVATFKFPTTYREKVDDEWVTRDIDYTGDPEKLVEDLNKALESSNFKLGDDVEMKFTLKDGKIGIETTGEGADQYMIATRSSSLGALGFDLGGITQDENETKSNCFSIDKFNQGVTTDFKDSYTTKGDTDQKSMKDYLVGKTLTVSYGGQTKTIDILTKEEAEKVANGEDLAGVLQKRLDKAFGSDKIEVSMDGGSLSFKALARKDAEGKDLAAETLTINSDSAEMRKIIGIEKNASNKLNLDSSLWTNRDKLGFTKADGIPYGDGDSDQFAADLEANGFTINGVQIKGVTADTTVNELIDKINSTKDAGVKASYMSGSNQLLLVASETGSGRKIELGGAAENVFGYGTTGESTDGLDAAIRVSYGNGVSQTITSSTNTFNLEGMKVTVSGTFGYQKNADGDIKVDVNGNKVLDTSQTVTFSAKADVDNVTKKVKDFFEAYNAMIEEVNTHVSTRPDSSFGPLTDAQKEEMDEKSIENWENKAKQGILFGESAITDFSVALQGVMVGLMRDGISYSDLEEMGITMSDDEKDGGKILFDESKFKAAMENDPETVSKVFTGGGDVQNGLASVIEKTLIPYATRYRSDNAASSDAAGSYGRLVEEAGSEKMPLSVSKNWIYTQLQEMQKTIDTLKTRLKSEQDRYIKQFTTMETMISKFNSQSSYLSQFQG